MKTTAAGRDRVAGPKTAHRNTLFGLTEAEIKAEVVKLGEPEFRGSQVFGWLYARGAQSFDAMTDLPAGLRAGLSGAYTLDRPRPSSVATSADGTKKYLFPTQGSTYVEAAFIPESTRATLCLSSQSGCKMGCLFCMTGRQGFQAHLPSGEILAQYAMLPEKDTITNIVYMGMGEPMDNLDAVLSSIEVLTHPRGYAFSPKRITVSTIGLIPAMRRYLAACPCPLAVSLHSPFDEERRSLMPVQINYPIREVVTALRDFDFAHRKLSFEYIVFRDVNHGAAHVRELARLLNPLRCRINLIAYHSIPGAPLEGADRATMETFQNELKARGLAVTIRRSRGLDIRAACGLLSTLELVQAGRAADPGY